jgi:hypothetical protein
MVIFDFCKNVDIRQVEWNLYYKIMECLKQ